MFYVHYPSQQIINCTNIMQSLGMQYTESKCWKGNVLDNVIGGFEVAFDEDRVNTRCHCMLCHASEGKQTSSCMFCVVVMMVWLMCKIASFLCGVQMILDCMVTYHRKSEISHYQSWCVCKKCYDASWGYTDCHWMIASCVGSQTLACFVLLC